MQNILISAKKLRSQEWTVESLNMSSNAESNLKRPKDKSGQNGIFYHHAILTLFAGIVENSRELA